MKRAISYALFVMVLSLGSSASLARIFGGTCRKRRAIPWQGTAWRWWPAVSDHRAVPLEVYRDVPCATGRRDIDRLREHGIGLGTVAGRSEGDAESPEQQRVWVGRTGDELASDTNALLGISHGRVICRR